MAIDFSKLTPDEQNQLSALWEQQRAPVQGPAMQPAMPTSGGMQRRPGDKMDPMEAMKLIQEQMGQQLQQKGGMLGQNVPHSQPLLGLFGAKQFRPLSDQTNYLPTAEGAIGQEAVQNLLPGNLPKEPTGRKFLGKEQYDQLMQAAASGKNKTPQDPNLGAFGEAFLNEAGSPAQVEAWKKLNPSTQASLAGNIPGFRTKRQDAFAQTEILSNGDAVQKNINDGKYYYSGTQIPYEGKISGQFLPKTQKSMADSTAIQLGKTQTLINSIDLAEQSLMPDKFGLWQGTFNKTIASYTNKDPEAAAMFRQLKTVFTEVTHDLYGGTLTGNELDQATDLLFSQYQSFEAVKSALGVQRNKFTNRLDNISGLLKAGNVRGSEAVKPTEPKAGTPKNVGQTTKGTKWKVIK